MEGECFVAMMTVGIRRDGKARHREYSKLYYRKHLVELRERNRIRWHGKHKLWWKKACFKAGVPLRELDL